PWIPQEERANSWGYGENIDSIEEFYNLLEKQVDALKASEYVVGFCYTQITDVEQEKNGIYRFDRSPKFDAARLRAIFERIPSNYLERR
ncbi:MAG: beta-glucuronidase, partial [Prevotella sp.]|nr:beta-glucuronidase [Prevotella sp.]